MDQDPPLPARIRWSGCILPVAELAIVLGCASRENGDGEHGASFKRLMNGSRSRIDRDPYVVIVVVVDADRVSGRHVARLRGSLSALATTCVDPDDEHRPCIVIDQPDSRNSEFMPSSA